MKRISPLAAFLVLLAGSMAYSQEAQMATPGSVDAGVDDLFDDVDDIQEAKEGDAKQVDHLSQFVTTSGMKIRGYFESEGGVGVGWVSWPTISDLSSGYDGTIGLEAAASISFDARPDPSFGFYGSFSTGLDALSGVYFTGLNVGSVYIDYTPFEPLYLKIGRFDTAWGQGRLFEGVTDLMWDGETGFTFRASVPSWLDGVTVMGLLLSSFYPSGTTPTYKNIGWAMKADKVVFDTMVSLAGRYQVYEGLNAMLSLKKVIFGVDVLCDAILHVDSDTVYPRVLAGFFKEWSDLVVYGEYYYSGAENPGKDHTAGLAIGFNNIIGTQIDLGFQWAHAFIDSSGSFAAGISWTPWKYVTASLALPVAYGSDGSRYVTTGNDDPAKRRLALVLLLKMKVSF